MVYEVKPIVYAEEYHEDRPSIFRESENLDRLLQAIFDVCYQQQLDFLWLSQNLLNVDVAEKSHLDFIGNIVGQPRFLSDFNTEPYFGYEGSYQSKPFSSITNPEIGGFWNSRSHFNTATARQLNDDEYRRLIKARAIYNQSNCTTNDLLEVVNLLSNSKNNTVQMLNHGLIQINTDDSSGIISYFVDRLLNDDNILPIAAGVRVGLQQSASEGSGDSGDSCKPTSITLSGGGNSQSVGFITMSRNGAPKVTLQPPSPSASPEEYANYTKQIFELTYFAQDGVSMAFVMGEFIVGIESKWDDNGDIISVMAGIPIDGVIDYVGTPYDLKEGVYDLNRLLTAGDPTIFMPNIVPEVNTLEIYPTPNTPPELDGYYTYGGDESGEPVVIRSCAKVVIEGTVDETVCTPTNHSILYKSYWDNRVPSDGELHARYRVNTGEWIDYTASTFDSRDYILKFFDSIRLPNGDRAIELVGGSVNPASSQTPFRSYQGENKLIGASALEPFSEEQTGVVRQYSTTIEFEVTQNDFNDLVYLAFGESIIAESCAIASWSAM